ncbi:hypothetical protein D9M69_551390 [compost metagenome]
MHWHASLLAVIQRRTGDDVEGVIELHRLVEGLDYLAEPFLGGDQLLELLRQLVFLAVQRGFALVQRFGATLQGLGQLVVTLRLMAQGLGDLRGAAIAGFDGFGQGLECGTSLGEGARVFLCCMFDG